MDQVQVNSSSTFSNLKERRFFPFLFSYIAGSFTLVQLVDWVTKRFAYSPHWTEAVFFLLLLLLPATIIFIYNHGRPGPDEWKPYEKWTYIGNILIALLLVGGFVKGKYMGKTAVAISTEDDQGNQVERMVPTSLFTQKIQFFPTKNTPAEEMWMRDVLSVVGELDLEQDKSIYASNSQSLQGYQQKYGIKEGENFSTAQMRKAAADRLVDYFVETEWLSSSEGDYKVNYKVYATKDGSKILDEDIEASSVYDVIDRFTLLFSETLVDENAIVRRKSAIDLPATDLITGEQEALEHYIESFQSAIASNDFTRALNQALEAEASDPKSAMIQNHLANIYIILNKSEEKTEASEKAISTMDGLPERQKLDIRKTYYQPQELQQMIKLLEYYIDLYPMDYDPYQELISYYSAIGADKKALQVAEMAHEAGHRGNNLKTLTRLYLRLNDSKSALKYYNTFESEYPEQAKESGMKGDILLAAEKYKEAEEFFKKESLARVNDPIIHAKLAKVSGKLLNFDEEEAYLKKALKVSRTTQDSLSYYYQLSTLMMRQGRIKEAIQNNEAVFNLMGESAPAFSIDLQRITYGNMSLFYYINEEQKAQDIAEEVIRKYGNNILDMECIVRLNYLLAFQKYEKLDSTFQACRESIEAIDGKRSVYLMQAYVAMYAEKQEEALNAIDSFAQAAGANEDNILMLKMFMKDRMGLHKEVLEDAEKVGSRFVEFPSFHYYVAKAYRGTGKTEKSREKFNLALSLWSNADKDYIYYQKAEEYLKSL